MIEKFKKSLERVDFAADGLGGVTISRKVS